MRSLTTPVKELEKGNSHFPKRQGMVKRFVEFEISEDKAVKIAKVLLDFYAKTMPQ